MRCLQSGASGCTYETDVVVSTVPGLEEYELRALHLADPSNNEACDAVAKQLRYTLRKPCKSQKRMAQREHIIGRARNRISISTCPFLIYEGDLGQLFMFKHDPVEHAVAAHHVELQEERRLMFLGHSIFMHRDQETVV